MLSPFCLNISSRDESDNNAISEAVPSCTVCGENAVDIMRNPGQVKTHGLGKQLQGLSIAHDWQVRRVIIWIRVFSANLALTSIYMVGFKYFIPKKIAQSHFF